MKKVLIISPYFPPVNAADMHRIRMSLPYFKENNWEAEIVTVDPAFSDLVVDDLLLKSIPSNIVIHKVKALSKKWTSKIGLGSIALRSLYFYRKKVNQLLQIKKYDLIYFSTTQFPVCILGAYWKKKFSVPYIIDMQDPWHSEYYENKPLNERPKKYWFSYRLNKYLEPIAMKDVDGLISVSQAYLDDLTQRYPKLKEIAKSVITFGISTLDFEISKLHQAPTLFDIKKINFLYVGRAGADMYKANRLLFLAFNYGLKTNFELFNQIRFHFIGTSYAPSGFGTPSVEPIAIETGVDNYVTEQTNRISFYAAISALQQADVLMMIGSDDSRYTASKIYPYILAEKPMIGVFHPKSSAVDIVKQCSDGIIITLDEETDNKLIEKTYIALKELAESYKTERKLNWHNFDFFTAKKRTQLQCELFEKAINAS